MKLRNTTTNELIELQASPFAQGGEGALYKIASPKKYQQFVAKIYHSNKRTVQRTHKLRYLIKNPPVFENSAQASLVSWPVAMLEENQQFVGFLMPLSYGLPLEVLATAKLPKHLPPSWKRFELGNVDALKLRQKVCFNIAVAIYHIHQTGHYVMVDLKPENILIQKNGLVSLVDMDSIEVVDGQQMLFPAAMVTPEFAPPEFHFLNRTAEAIPLHWDTFSMAIIFYKILLGIHPFAATSKGEYEEAVGLGDKLKHGLYVHNKKFKHYFRIIPFPHLEFYNFPAPVQYLFNLCFIQGIKKTKVRPTAEDWCLALDNQQLKKEADYYVIPKEQMSFKLATLPEERSWLFELSFEHVFGRLFENNLPVVVTKLEKEAAALTQTKWKWLAWLLVVLGVGLFAVAWHISLLLLVLSAVCLLLHYGIIKKRELRLTIAKQPSFSIKLEPHLQTFFDCKIAKLFELHQKRKASYRKVVMLYQKKVENIKFKWQQQVLEWENKTEQLTKEKREKYYQTIQKRNEQPLWKQFIGKTAKQKQQYLENKHLPQQLQELEAQRKQKIKEIDKEQQAYWEDLEKEHYQNLDLIDKINNSSTQKVLMKEQEELEFTQKRQEIIDSIQEQKEEAKSYYQSHQKLAKSSVKGYCGQLETIEWEAMNKKMAIESSYDLKFQKLLSEIKKEKENITKGAVKVQNQFILEYKKMLEDTLLDLEDFRISREVSLHFFYQKN